MTTEKKNLLNSMKIDREINFSDLRRKSEKKSCRDKKVHNSVKTLPIELCFFANILTLLVSNNSAIKQWGYLLNLESQFKKINLIMFEGVRVVSPKK